MVVRRAWLLAAAPRAPRAPHGRWLPVAMLLLLGCARGCFVLTRGVQQGKPDRLYAKMEPDQTQFSVPIFPTGSGVTLGGVAVEVCGARRGGVALRVEFPWLVGERRGRGVLATFQIDTFTVPYSVGHHALSEGKLQLA